MSVDSEFATIVPITNVDGKLFAGEAQLGPNLPTIQPGWSASSIARTSLGVVLMQLQHEGGQSALWYLDESLRFIAPNLDLVPEGPRQELIALYTQSYMKVWRGVVGAGETIEPSFAAHPILSLVGAPRDEFLKTYSGEQVSQTLYWETDGAPAALRVKDADGEPADLDIERISQVLRYSTLSIITSAINQGAPIRIPALASQGDVSCQGGFALTANTFLYRFVEPQRKLSYIVIASHLYNRVIGVYFPDSGLMIYKSADDRNFLENSDPGKPIILALMLEVAAHPHQIADYLRAVKPNSFAFVYCHHHLGHHLWNDLTGVDYIQEKTVDGDSWVAYVLGAQQSEMYGKLDDLFPKFQGRVRRDVPNLEAYKLEFYRTGRIPVAPTGFRVTQTLRDAIVDWNKRDPDYALERAVHDRLRASGTPIVLIGLRVENRTLVNMEEFCVELIDGLVQRYGSVAIVLDGHNMASVDGKPVVFTSHMQGVAKVAPIAVERDIVRSLQDRYSGTNVEIIDLIGATMTRSIYWSCNCDYFVTPWGAGLAKYRWVANKEGVVLLNLSYHEHKYDRHIYFDDRTMENSGEYYYLPAEYIEDVVDAEVNINVPDGRRNNYKVKPGGVEQVIAGAAKWVRSDRAA